jgi:hypothetical protein
MMPWRWLFSGLLLLSVCGLLALQLVSVPTVPSRSRVPKLTPKPRWTPPPSPAAPPPVLAPVESTPAPAGIATPLPEPAASPSTAPTAPGPAPTSIPGIDADGMIEGLRNGGLKCSSAAFDTRGLTWTCAAEGTAADVLVTLHGESTSSIAWVRATVSRATDFSAVSFLQDIAAVRYSGAEPPRARDWVRRTLSTGGAIVIGPVRLELSGIPGERTLDVAAAGLRR